MKVVFVNGNPFWGGAEKWHVAASAFLKERGHDVYFFASSEEIASPVRESGVPVKLMGFRSDVDPGTIFGLYRAFKKIRPDAVILNSERDVRLGGSAARLAGVPVRIHRKGIWGMRNNARYKWSYQKLRTHVMCVAQAIKDEIVELRWMDPDSLKVIHSGVDLDKFSPVGSKNLRNEIGAVNEDIVIGAVARLSSIKGFEYLIDAFKDVREKYPSAKLVFVGTGRLEDDLKARADEAGMGESVIFAGFRKEPADAIRSMDMVALPSVHTEGLPNSALEAMACGVPVVSTTIAGIPEAVEDGVTGILVPPRDAGALAEALLQLISNPDKRNKFGDAGRKRVAERFKVSDQMALFERWLKEIIQ